jgi:hypothetical protein
VLRLAASTVVAALLLAVALDAQDRADKKAEVVKKKRDAGGKKLDGEWTRSDGDTKVAFQFKKRALRFSMTAGDKKLTVDADYGLSKDGVVFGRVTKVEKEGVEGPAEGYLFSFHVERKGNTLTVSDLKGQDADQARQVVEGDYTRTKGGKARPRG